jgi:hypothetical protein
VPLDDEELRCFCMYFLLILGVDKKGRFLFLVIKI